MSTTKLRVNQINEVELKDFFLQRCLRSVKKGNAIHNDIATWAAVNNAWTNYPSPGLIVNDVTHTHKIEFTPLDEFRILDEIVREDIKTTFNDALRNKIDNLQEVAQEKIDVEELIECKFRVVDLNDKTIGETYTFEAAEQLFLDMYPHFFKDSVKHFIYEI